MAGAGRQGSGGVKSAGGSTRPKVAVEPLHPSAPTAPRLSAATHLHPTLPCYRCCMKSRGTAHPGLHCTLPFRCRIPSPTVLGFAGAVQAMEAPPPHPPLYLTFLLLHTSTSPCHHTLQVLCELSAVHTSPSMGVGFCTATPAPGSTEQQTCTVEGQPSHAPDITPVASWNTPTTHASQLRSAEVNKGSTGSTQLRQTRACLVLRKGPGHQQRGCEAVNVWGKVASWQLQR